MGKQYGDSGHEASESRLAQRPSSSCLTAATLGREAPALREAEAGGDGNGVRGEPVSCFSLKSRLLRRSKSETQQTLTHAQHVIKKAVKLYDHPERLVPVLKMLLFRWHGSTWCKI